MCDHSVDASASEQAALLVRKLHQCCTLFDFDDPLTEIKSKEVKRACLSELIEYFGKSGVANTDAAYIELITMVSLTFFYYRCHNVNIFGMLSLCVPLSDGCQEISLAALWELDVA